MRRFIRRFVSTPSGALAAALVGLMVVVMVVGPTLLGGSASDRDASQARQGFSLGHPFGTDDLGRDVLARVVVATRLTIVLATVAVLVSVAVGYSLGLVAAMAGARVRHLIRSALYLALAFPPIIVALFVSAAAGQTAGSAALATGTAFVPLYARTMLNLASAVRSTEYVRAARLLGLSQARLLARHVTPNVAGPLWIQSTLGLGTAMVAISALSFLGVGVPSPQYDWGSLLADGLDRIFTTPAVVMGPALAITATGLVFAFVGEVGARAMDPTRWTHGEVAERTTPSPPPPRGEPGEGVATPPVRQVGDATVVVRDLHVTFPDPAGAVLAVAGVSFSVERGTAVGIVGESGSGKSMTASAIAGLVPPPGQVRAAELRVDGHDVIEAPRPGGADGGLGMVFQDPMSSLTPTLRIGTQLCEAVRFHRRLRRDEARLLAIERLREVRMPSPETVMRLYPHQLSGGMRQRVMIAMALMTGPSVLVADEPTTALDVSVQAEILRLLDKLRGEHQLTTVLISHDIAVVRAVCDRVLVMQAGRIVEDLPVSRLDRAEHPYTSALLAAVPELSDVPSWTEHEPGDLGDPFDANVTVPRATAGEPGGEVEAR